MKRSGATKWRRSWSTRPGGPLSVERDLRAAVHDRRTAHPADRAVHRPLWRRREARSTAAVRRRRTLPGRLADGAAATTMMRYTVVLTAAYPPIAREILARDFDVIEHPTEQARSEDDMITILAEADAAITLLSDPLTRRVLASNPNLRMIANYAVGYNNVDVAAARELGITITNTPGVLTEATADLTMALILAVTRRLIEADRDVR